MQPKYFATARGRYQLEYDVDSSGATAKLTSPEGAVTGRAVRSEDDLLDLVELTGMPPSYAERIARTEWAGVEQMLAAQRRPQ